MPVSSAHTYIQEHYQMPLEPAPSSRFKQLKRLVGRCIAHITSAQNTFNANVVRVLNTLQQQSDSLHARLDRLERDTDAVRVELHQLQLSREQGDHVHRNLTAAIEQVQELQQHHGTVIGSMLQRMDGIEPAVGQTQQRLDGMMALISHCQSVNEQLLARVRAASHAIVDLTARQDDLLAVLQRAEHAQQDMALRQDDLLQSLQFHTARLESELSALHSALAQAIARQHELAQTHAQLTSAQSGMLARQDELARAHAGITARQDELARANEGITARQDELARAHEGITARQNDIVHTQEQLAAVQREITARQDENVRTMQHLIQQFTEGMRQAGEVGARILRAEEGFVQLRGMVEMLDTHVALLRDGLAHALPPARSPRAKGTQRAMLEEVQALWNDTEYQRFEAAQRGSEQDVQARMQWCLEFLAPLDTSVSAHILDLGCGRGELLELLERAGRHARGVDLNKVAVAAARERKLQVTCGDVFETLAHTPPDTLAAVTAFHLIEHLTYCDITRLLAEVHRVLRPGGLFICETPNALNLRVAASEFYQDPTHVRPVHPALLKHALRAAGFVSVELRFLHPFPPDEQLRCDLAGTNDRVCANFDMLNRLLFGNRDCACIARKEAAP